jgi:hypothetical protein
MPTLSKRAAALWHRQVRLVAALGLLVALAACAVQFAPPYDETIENETAQLHQNFSLFFESIAVGTPGSTGYANHREFYAVSLATIQNLKVRAMARGASFGSRRLGAGLIRALGGEAAAEDGVDESTALFGVLFDQVEMLRDFDMEGFLDRSSARNARVPLDVTFSSILEYEAFLKR